MALTHLVAASARRGPDKGSLLLVPHGADDRHGVALQRRKLGPSRPQPLDISATWRPRRLDPFLGAQLDHGLTVAGYRDLFARQRLGDKARQLFFRRRDGLGAQPAPQDSDYWRKYSDSRREPSLRELSPHLPTRLSRFCCAGSSTERFAGRLTPCASCVASVSARASVTRSAQ